MLETIEHINKIEVKNKTFKNWKGFVDSNYHCYDKMFTIFFPFKLIIFLRTEIKIKTHN